MNKNLCIALCATFLSFCTLYAPQPILPLLAAEFGVSATMASLLITVTLAPLGLAPLVYGYFLQAIPARTMLRAAVLLLLLDQLALFAAAEFWQLLALRFIQGLLMPAIFTALMTYCASMSRPGAVRRTMGCYIGASVLGGFTGRALGGLLAHHLDWHWVFAALAAMLAPAWLALRALDADAEINFQRLDLRGIRRALADPICRNSYLVLFGVFAVFAGILNLLPFRAGEVAASLGPLGVSLLYTGYLVGIPIAVFSERLSRAFGGVSRALLAGLAINAAGLLAFALPQVAAWFAGMLVFAGGMFFIHAVLSGLVNDLATEHKGVVNGLYVSVYYVSGALGSWLPGYLYLRWSWNALLGASLLALAVAAVFAAKIRA
ncbi:MAG: MFS transporter [Gammaproteobacteria bacterium]